MHNCYLMYILSLVCIAVPVTNYAQGHEDVCESGGRVPRFLTLGTRWRWVVNLTPRSLSTHLLEGVFVKMHWALSVPLNTQAVLPIRTSHNYPLRKAETSEDHDLINKGREILKTSGPTFWNDFLSSVYVAVLSTFGIRSVVQRK